MNIIFIAVGYAVLYLGYTFSGVLSFETRAIVSMIFMGNMFHLWLYSK